jgi:hypothetical protein
MGAGQRAVIGNIGSGLFLFTHRRAGAPVGSEQSGAVLKDSGGLAETSFVGVD